MIPETEVLSDLIGTIYDTTLDRGLWPEVLRKSTEFVGGSAASLYSKNAACKTGNGFLHWDSRSNTPGPDYFKEYVGIDPVTTRQFRFDVGQVYSVDDCMPYSEFVKTRIYKEWARPQRWADHLATTLDKSATSFSLFGIFRSDEQGLVNDEMRRRMRLIIPHIRRAVLIGKVLDLHTTAATASADTLDGLVASQATVKIHLQHLFAKTGTNRQTTLCLAALAGDERLRAIGQSEIANNVGLSPREQECLEWLSKGLRNARIAECMGITLPTVEMHLAKARRKLRVATREQALVKALILGLICP